MPEAAVVVAAIALVAAAYGRGVRRLWAHAGAGRVTHRWQAAAFAAGLGALALVLATPFEHLAGERLWAHMVQHVVLVAVAAPLLVLGNPLATLSWALPAGLRERSGGWSRRLARSHADRWVAWTAAAFVLHTAALWVWHLPGLHQEALAAQAVHGLEHASFLGTGLFFWWALVGARRRSLYGPAVLVTFAAALQGSLLGALMTLASSPWYPAYGEPQGPLTALEDQQIAGVVMWGPCGAIYALAAVLLFAAWIRPHPPTFSARLGSLCDPKRAGNAGAAGRWG